MAKTPTNKANDLIRAYAAVAFAYIRPAERASWLRGWRRESRRIGREFLKVKLERESCSFRRSQPIRAHCSLGDGTAGARSRLKGTAHYG